MKTKLKVTTALLASLFVVSIIVVSIPVIAAEPDHTLMIDIMAKGDDIDIPGYDPGIYRATTSIIGKIEFDKVSGELLGRVEFHVKIYDESGKKVYSMKGELKNGIVVTNMFQFPCDVRNVTWTNLWLVVGEGKYKTTDIYLDIVHRHQPITLPNTEGKYIPASIMMMVSPNGENNKEEDWDGWAFAGVMEGGIPVFGGVTYLTKYMEKFVPLQFQT